jgi:signal transduction histidine kinase
MNRSLIALWVALAAAILTIVALAQFWIGQRDHSTQARVQELLAAQLAPVRQAVKRVTEEYSLDLGRQTSAMDLSSPIACVELKRNPLIRTLVVVDRQDELLFYPRDLRNASSEERALVDEVQQLLRDRFPKMPTAARAANERLQQIPMQQAAVPQIDQNSRVSQPSSQNDSTLENKPVAEDSNWITWYHRRGLMIGYVWQQDARWQAIAVLPRSRWMADIVSELSDTSNDQVSSSPLANSLRQLVDVEGKVVHQWSSLPQSQWAAMMQSEPDAEVATSPPLEGWRLREFASDAYRKSMAGDDLRLPIWLAVAAMSASLVLTGLLVTFNINRQIRLAEQRVSFVNQVSHELRTPLTNICMYADLVAQSFDREEEPTAEELQQQERLSVIRSESRRLTRLVNNVLEFARPAPTKTLQRSPGELDLIVAETLATFEPKLEELGFTVERKFNCPGKRLLDRGAVEQILVNLIGNAEKYAASGKYLCIETVATEGGVAFTITDHGPGIPPRMREQIFKPFVRMTDRLEDPAGTGIGLTIARELAQRHGGDCELLATNIGASFRCTLEATRSNECYVLT